MPDARMNSLDSIPEPESQSAAVEKIRLFAPSHGGLVKDGEKEAAGVDINQTDLGSKDFKSSNGYGKPPSPPKAAPGSPWDE